MIQNYWRRSYACKEFHQALARWFAVLNLHVEVLQFWMFMFFNRQTTFIFLAHSFLAGQKKLYDSKFYSNLT